MCKRILIAQNEVLITLFHTTVVLSYVSLTTKSFLGSLYLIELSLFMQFCAISLFFCLHMKTFIKIKLYIDWRLYIGWETVLENIMESSLGQPDRAYGFKYRIFKDVNPLGHGNMSFYIGVRYKSFKTSHGDGYKLFDLDFIVNLNLLLLM